MTPSPRVAAPRGRLLTLALAVACASAPHASLAQRAAPSAPEAMPGLEDPAPLRPAWMGLHAAPGVHVQDVVKGGPADRAGLKAGDLLTSVNFEPTVGEPGLMGVLRESRPGDELILDVMRDGKDLRLTLVLGEFPLDYLAERQAALAEEARRAKSRGPSAPPAPPVAAPAPSVPFPGAVMQHLGQEERAFLGVRLQELTPGLAVFFGLPEDSPGFLVEHVYEDSPAATVGLEAGDVLLAVEGQDLRDMTELGELLRRRAPGDEIGLRWWSRAREVVTARARLTGRTKEIWVVSPPERSEPRMDEGVRESLEARLRMLEEQRRRLDAEQASLERSLVELARDRKP